MNTVLWEHSHQENKILIAATNRKNPERDVNIVEDRRRAVKCSPICYEPLTKERHINMSTFSKSKDELPKNIADNIKKFCANDNGPQPTAVVDTYNGFYFTNKKIVQGNDICLEYNGDHQLGNASPKQFVANFRHIITIQDGNRSRNFMVVKFCKNLGVDQTLRCARFDRSEHHDLIPIDYQIRVVARMMLIRDKGSPADRSIYWSNSYLKKLICVKGKHSFV